MSALSVTTINVSAILYAYIWAKGIKNCWKTGWPANEKIARQERGGVGGGATGREPVARGPMKTNQGIEWEYKN